MDRHAAPEKKDSLRLFFLFCIVVLLLIVGSLLIKTVHTIRESKYDTGNSFVLTVLTDDGVVIYPIDPEKKEFSAVRINGAKKLDITRNLHIPQNAQVQLTSVDTESVRLKPLLSTLFFKQSDLTWYDIVRLMIVTSAMSEETDNEKKINIREIDDLSFERRFYDPEIVREKASVAIVNAAGVSGIGSRLEQVLSNLGVSVISVTTAQNSTKRSEIQFIDQSLYTLKKLHSLLDFPMMETQDLSASDILIIIGEDMSKTDLF